MSHTPGQSGERHHQSQPRIMVMSGYLSPAKRRMFWEKKEDAGNTLVKKAMSRNTFDDMMCYTHFTGNQKPKDHDYFWKVRLLFNTADKYIEKTEYVSVDESMIKYLGPHPLKQFIRG
uniref:PiggyBac transposable element-derived protein domain-containing protein n=1 Tax=Scylla olivacea TaxID=85551 RepID=A0A0N7ZAI1_SCYOL